MSLSFPTKLPFQAIVVAIVAAIVLWHFVGRAININDQAEPKPGRVEAPLSPSE